LFGLGLFVVVFVVVFVVDFMVVGEVDVGLLV
jgi:hypothetical protein